MACGRAPEYGLILAGQERDGARRDGGSPVACGETEMRRCTCARHSGERSRECVMLMVLMAALLPRGACVATRALAPAFNGALFN